MKEVRRNDDMRLRELIISKREWTIKERQKGFDAIKRIDEQKAKLTEQQEAIGRQIVLLDGCLMALDDLMTESKNMDAEDKKLQELKKAEEKSKKKDTPKKKTTRKKSATKKS